MTATVVESEDDSLAVLDLGGTESSGRGAFAGRGSVQRLTPE